MTPAIRFAAGRSPRFLCFLIGTTLNAAVVHFLRFGVSWLAMRETGSAVTFAAIFSVTSFVEVYFKPVLAPVADHFDRLSVYRASVGLSALIVVTLLLVVLFLPFSVVVTAGLLTALSLVAALRDPASAGLVPSLVCPEALTGAQSLRSTAESVAGLGAPAVSGLLLAWGGVSVTLEAAAVSSLVSLIATLGIRVKPAGGSMPAVSPGSCRGMWRRQFVDGIRAVVLTRSERTGALGIAVTNAGLYPFFFITLPLWVAHDLGAPAATMALIEVAFGIGIFAGSILLIGPVNARIGRFHTLVTGNGLLGASLIGAAFVTTPVALAVCFSVGGAGLALFNINASTLRGAATPPAFRSRMAAGVAFLSSSLNPFAAQGMGLMVDRIGATKGVFLSGALILAATVLLLRNRDAKALLIRPSEDIVGAYASLYPRAFITRGAGAGRPAA